MARNEWWRVAVAAAIALGGCGRGAGQAPPAEGRPIRREAAEQSPPGPSRTIKTVREAAVAGLFYPGDEKELAREVDKLLAAAKPAGIKGLRGLVAPHAGYAFSGPTAAIAYKQLEGRPIRTVVVMSPSHYALFDGVYVPEVDAYATPLGRILLSPLAQTLAASRPFTARPDCRVMRPGWWRQSPLKAPPPGEDRPDTWEHSLEVQLPFLQRVLKDFELVPVEFGEADAAAIEAAAKLLAARLDERTLLVASSDLSHQLPQEAANKLDTACIEAICKLDPDGIAERQACGRLPIRTLIHVARQKGWKARLLDYRTSGDTSGDRSAVVGYAAIAFFDQQETPTAEAAPSAEFTPEERKRLVELARKTVEAAVRGRELPEVELAQWPAKMAGPRGCFVTLNKNGQLRGCIGHIVPQEPLVRAVSQNAVAAALKDTRFQPVAPAELDRIEIEISVLTIPRRLEFQSPEDLVAKLRPRVDGVVLQVGRRLATYLPQVWEKIPDKETFMSELAEKAGLPPTAWKSPEAVVLTYQAEVFEEKPGGKQPR